MLLSYDNIEAYKWETVDRGIILVEIKGMQCMRRVLCSEIFQGMVTSKSPLAGGLYSLISVKLSCTLGREGLK